MQKMEKANKIVKVRVYCSLKKTKFSVGVVAMDAIFFLSSKRSFAEIQTQRSHSFLIS